MRRKNEPLLMLNFVMMRDNADELEKVVDLAAELGVDRINFKQCDVVRDEEGRRFGLFASKADKEIRALQKTLKKARKKAKKRKIETTAFSFTPDELPVCGQDPRRSLFVRWDGGVSPCISLALGGPTCFLGKEAYMPFVIYGRLAEEDIMKIWNSGTCRFYRDRFDARVNAHDRVLSRADFEPSLVKLKEALEKARKAMPEAPEGCRICHYLYDI